MSQYYTYFRQGQGPREADEKGVNSHLGGPHQLRPGCHRPWQRAPPHLQAQQAHHHGVHHGQHHLRHLWSAGRLCLPLMESICSGRLWFVVNKSHAQFAETVGWGLNILKPNVMLSVVLGNSTFTLSIIQCIFFCREYSKAFCLYMVDSRYLCKPAQFMYLRTHFCKIMVVMGGVNGNVHWNMNVSDWCFIQYCCFHILQNLKAKYIRNTV